MRFETTCRTCGKRTFRNRRDARAMAKQIPGAHMTAYRCPVDAGGWHLGHLPRDVVRGVGDRRSYEAAVVRRRERAS